MVKKTGGQLLAEALVHERIDTVFAIPGIQLDWAMEALRQHSDRIRLFVPRHEQTTTYMADGYARVTGRPGVAMVVPGPGVLNASAGLATAYAANSPVIMISGHIHLHGIGAGYGMLHEISNQTTLLGCLTKWNRNVTRVEDIPGAVAEAVSRAVAGRPRPTAIEISHTLLESSIEVPDGVTPVAPTHVEAGADLDTAGLETVAALIDAARFPVLYVGGGVLAANATAELQALAERARIPVVMSDNGRGALSDRHPLAFSTLGGRALFEHADLAVVVGSRFMDAMTPTCSWTVPGLKFAFINIDAADMGAPRESEVSVRADARAALGWLAERVAARTVLSDDQAARVKAWAQEQIDRISPQIDFLRAIRTALPEDGIFVNELTQVGYLARVAFPVYAPRTYIAPGYQGTLGYGFPAALGAAVGAGGSRVVCITGDGGFGWNLQELATARKYGLPVTLIVFNDGYFGNVRAIQKRLFGENVAVDLENPDFMTLAKAFRVPGVVAHSAAELGAAVRESLSEAGPVLIEVPVGEMPNPWPLLRLQPMAGNPASAPPNPLAS